MFSLKTQSNDGCSEFGDEDEGWETDEQIWETVRIEQRKKDSTTSQVIFCTSYCVNLDNKSCKKIIYPCNYCRLHRFSNSIQ